MPGASYRFDRFLVDRVSYRVLENGSPLDLTPKLLDLLLHLLDNAGVLVTKEQLLDALWPDANVTENALTQAISELRQALGDDAGAPAFIKTVARRGYRFIAPVERLADLSAMPSSAQSSGASPEHSRGARTEYSRGTEAIAVMDFSNVTGDPDAAWLSAGIAETVTADLPALGLYRIIDRGRVIEAAHRTDGSLRAVAGELDVSLAVVGSYQRNGDQIRITSRIVNVKTGEALADAKVDGALQSIFELQDRVVAQFSKELGLGAPPIARKTGSQETPSLEAFRAFTEGWLQLETLDVREIPRALANFERAIAVDARYALAYTGLASAQLAAFEATRSENAPDNDLLGRAIANARAAVTLNDTLAEAHAALAFALVSAWETPEALREARRAVALEPSNWRHFFRLGHASWGDERLRAAANTLALYPDFAFGFFQIAMVYVARGHLREAETVLRQGAAVQDRQIGRGERYPALGLHWLLGLVRLAQDDAGEALQEFDRELTLAAPHRLYGREYEMNTTYARGVCMLKLERYDESLTQFSAALALYPGHAQSHLGMALALRAMNEPPRCAKALEPVRAALKTLTAKRPIEAAIVQSQLAAAEGDVRGSSAMLSRAVTAAPPGFAGWTIPVDPLIRQLIDPQALSDTLARLADRAR